jgi:hypothetical protein
MSAVADFVGDTVDSVTGSLFGGDDAADAAREAGDVQAQATIKAAELQQEGLQDVLGFQREALATSRSDLQPFRAAGVNALQQVAPLINDPQAQADFVQDNPFFEALAQDAQRRIFNTGAASGRGFAGGTAQALNNSIMLLGNDLVDRQIGRQMGLVNTGQASAAGQANAAQNFGQQAGAATMSTNRTIGDLMTQGANAQASGIVGAANAQQGALNTAINTGLGIGSIVALSDRRYKAHIAPLIKLNGVQWYSYKYINGPWDVGVMADEVPHAVTEIDGVKYVNYGEIYGN